MFFICVLQWEHSGSAICSHLEDLPSINKGRIGAQLGAVGLSSLDPWCAFGHIYHCCS
jgi:hypothetical protein